MVRFTLYASGPYAVRKLVLLAALLFLPLGLSAQTADDIITKYIAARGGLAKIKSVQSERVTGSVIFAPTVQGRFVVERERPLKMHMQITFGQQTLIRTFDGKSAGWIYNPFNANPAVEPMTEGDMRNILEEADFEGPFVDYKAKGNQVEFVGKTAVEGKPAFKLKLTSKSGDISYFSFDASTYLMLRFQGTRKSGDKDVASETFFRDFREVNDLLYPFLIESSTPSTGESQKIIADKIEVNVPLSESLFKKPEAPADAPEKPTTTATPPADSPKPH